MNEDVLQVTALTRRFGAVVANDDISLRVRAGAVVGLLGHNGAGKTTLVSQVVGLLRPDAGAIQVSGCDAVADPAAARRRVSIQPQGQAPIDGLSPRLAIEMSARLRGLSRTAARAAAQHLGEELDITEWLDRRALPDGRGLSGGIRRLTAFAMALAAPTPLLILDEPTNDVDAARRRLLWRAVRRRGDEGAGVLLVTHNVAEAEQIVDDLVILHRGKVVTSGSPAHLRGTQEDDLRLELQSPPAVAGAADEHAVPLAVRRRVRTGRRLLLTFPAGEAAVAVDWATTLRTRGIIEGYTLGPATLEDAYLSATTDRRLEPAETGQESAHA
ncbi:ABC transporter ATP-binding protein [Ruania zhangjianzhongii]|uniref:ABC transporter ATP-binding protein n=1 Tax=Ruania zhangjianzhongii TaxID=2603206 RepID=UPI0011C776C0|nr:ATP-binding cassette domain-containing protein [Ruania zhangjianzhongii]